MELSRKSQVISVSDLQFSDGYFSFALNHLGKAFQLLSKFHYDVIVLG